MELHHILFNGFRMALPLPLFSGLQGADARVTSEVLKRQTTVGFQLGEDGMFDGLDLDSACKQVLYQQINCDAFVSTLGQKAYHGSLGDQDLTDAVCSESCSRALTTARRRISGACASTPDLLPGYPVLALIDSIITGWEETCLTDSSTGEYCNDIIEAFDPVEDISDFPEEQLCSYCYGAKLSLMQGSAYSAYDEYHAETLAYINENCDTSYPTEPQEPTFPSPEPGEDEDEPECADETYKTKEGDTCDSIALANSVSAATLYYINPSLINCTAIPAGQELCLPPACEETHTVVEEDDCVELGVAYGIGWQRIISWNAGVNSRCTNIFSENPFWGRVICASAPGGTLEDGGGDDDSGDEETPGNGDIGGPGGSGDGYADAPVDPPEGATVAEGTTLYCGQFVQAEDGLSCSVMVARGVVTMDLFLAANPSLETAASCTSDLLIGDWYCLHPVRGFDMERGGFPGGEEPEDSTTEEA